MKRRELILELGSVNAPVLRAASFLLRDSRLQCTVRIVRRPQEAPAANVLRLEAGSVVRPLLSLLWGGDRSERNGAYSVGLTQAVWFEGSPNEHWRSASSPLPSRSFYGTPDRDRPWVLVAPGLSVQPGDLEYTTGLSNPQLHLLRPRQAAKHRHSVYWLPSGRILASLLGRVDAVVAPNGPLAWDAARVGAPHFELAASGGVPKELANRRLARLVPETLVGDAVFWDGIVEQLLDGSASTRWGTSNWLQLARDRAHLRRRGLLGNLRVKRKWLKLRRDPAAFVADSKWFKLITRSRPMSADALRQLVKGDSQETEQHPLFDPAWYTAQLAGPLTNGETALSHYLRVGATQNLSPHPLFDGQWYASQLDRPLPKGQSALQHYLLVGAARGLSPHPLFAPNQLGPR